MEVHHHPHVEKKNFKEYFLEFVMIFLAVTLGFIAENIREDISNQTKEKEYMKSMLMDLISDTAMLNGTIRFASGIGSGLDSLGKALYSANETDSSTLKIYRLHAMYTRLIGVDFNEETEIQLRNSGGMQLIRNTTVRSVIAKYWNETALIDEITQALQNVSFPDLSYAIFNRSYEHLTGLEKGTGMSIVSIDPNASLMTNDKNQLINYANRMTRSVSIINIFLIPHLNKQKKSANDLINLIKKEYDIK